jgi:hypothetical protein
MTVVEIWWYEVTWLIINNNNNKKVVLMVCGAVIIIATHLNVFVYNTQLSLHADLKTEEM